MAYRPYDEQSILEYARQFTGVLDTGDRLLCKEIGDGNLNLVFRVSDQHGHSLIFKQALPYARVVGESWPLTVDRSRIECAALRKHGELAPGRVPVVYDFDAEQATIAMEDLSAYTVMRTALIHGYRGEAVYQKLGEYLAKTLFFTSDLYLDPVDKKRFVQEFINPELCRITELLIFTDPYYDAETNVIPPELANEVRDLWSDAPLKQAVARLKSTFLTRAESLLHGDLHTGSIMVQGDDVRVFDAEFAFFGPVGFDVGLLIGNLLLNLAANQPGFSDRGDAGYWLTAIERVWGTFESHFTELWKDHVQDPVLRDEGFRSWYLNRTLCEAIGFAGAEVIRRTIGLAHVQDLDGIEDEQRREAARKFALRIGRWAILKAGEFHSVEQFTDGLHCLI